MARLYKPFRARHSELMSQSLSSFLRQDVPASAPRAAVALQRFSPADSGAVAQALPLLLDRAGLASSFSLRSAHVLVKPNLLTATPLACTSPVVVAAVCRWLLDQGARVRVGDSPGFGTATAVARQTGVEEALRPLGLRVESLADPRPLELPLRRGGPVSFGVARVALESDVIFSLPRVKAHSQMRLTLAVKNLFGCVCGLLGQRAAQCVGRNARRDISHTGTADLCIHAGAKGHSQQHRLRAIFQMLHHIPTPQDACFGKGSRVRFQPDRPGRCRRQQRHGACFQQGHGAVVRFPSGPEIPRCLCCIDRRRFCQHQRLRCTDHSPHLLAFLK